MGRTRAWATVAMEGRRFGFLTVTERAGSFIRKNGKTFATWRCRCTCGQEVVVVGQKLRRGDRKACAVNGHFWSQRKNDGLPKRHPSEYGSWESMIERCECPTHKNYKNYGGRGITVCEEWGSFRRFLADMGVKPAPDFTIERKDVNGNYEPSNCRWATRAEQSRNMRRSVYVEYEGKRQLLIDVIVALGVSGPIVRGRLKNGWSLESALSVPVNRYRNSANVSRETLRGGTSV